MCFRKSTTHARSSMTTTQNPMFDGGGVTTPRSTPDPTAQYFHTVGLPHEGSKWEKYSADDSTKIEEAYCRGDDYVTCTNPVFEVRFGANASSSKWISTSKTGFLQVRKKTAT